MASTDKTPPNMARLQELADAWERGEALKLLPAEVEDEIFDALPWLLARERELTEAAQRYIKATDYGPPYSEERATEIHNARAALVAVLNREEPK